VSYRVLGCRRLLAGSLQLSSLLVQLSSAAGSCRRRHSGRCFSLCRCRRGCGAAMRAAAAIGLSSSAARRRLLPGLLLGQGRGGGKVALGAVHVYRIVVPPIVPAK
jgi:hypothetical protein